MFRKAHGVHEIYKFHVLRRHNECWRRKRTAPAWFVCYNILNYANIDVSNSVVDVLGSTKLRAVANQRQQEVNFVDFTVSKRSESDTHLWQSNSEVRKNGLGRACSVPQVC